MSRYKIKRYIVGTKNKEKEIRKVMNHFARKERYLEHDLKRETMVIDSENEKVVFYPSREDSFERLCENAFYFEGGKSAEDVALAHLLIEKIWKELEKLSKVDKQIFLLSVIYGKKQSDIAKRFGLSQSMVSKKINTIRKKIKKQTQN